MVAAVIALRTAEVPVGGDVILTLVVDEEYASLGTEAVVKEYRANAAIVAEPTDLELGVAHKGFAWVSFETSGRAAHGSRYDQGIDAITAMGRILRELEILETRHLRNRRHPLLGRGSVHAGLIEGGDGLSTYPQHCRLQVERRTLPVETGDGVGAEMREIVRRAGEGDASFVGTAEVVFFRPGYEISPDAPIAAAVAEAAARVLGRQPQAVGLAPWMDSAILGNAGIPSVLFGPAGAGAHSRLEYVDLDSVVQCANVFAEVIVAYCRGTQQ